MLTWMMGKLLRASRDNVMAKLGRKDCKRSETDMARTRAAKEKRSNESIEPSRNRSN